MSWVEQARSALAAARRPASGWGYRAGGESSVEPTVLAALALAAGGAAPVMAEAGAWLAGLQQGDGALGVSSTVRGPRWPTAPAAVLWRAAGGFEAARARAVAWLTGRNGLTWEPGPDSPYGHDTRLPGWPWVGGTHPWIEPTAWAILALGPGGDGAGDGEGARAAERRAEGVRLIADRALPDGGWNYGNRSVFGTVLRPRPAPTGMALLALAAAGGDDPGGHAAAAAGYLENALPGIRSPQSLAWGLLGLAAWGRRPAAAGAWLAEAFTASEGRQSTLETATLLLAAEDAALALLGATGGRS